MNQTDVFGFAYIEQFSCLADKCEEGCCHEWPIHIDSSKADDYRHNYPPLYDLIAKEGDGFVMKREGTNCTANECGLCSVHRDYGEHLLSDACIDYPRLYRSNEHFFMRAGTMSCPEVARKCLFDDHPFDMVPTSLPSNHQDGAGITNSKIDQLDTEKWTRIVSALLDKVVNNDFPVENLLQQLLELAPSLARTNIDHWEEVIQSIDPSLSQPVDKEVSAHQQAEYSTRLLMVLLEHLDRVGSQESLRQSVVTSFDVLTNTPDPLRCQLQSIYKIYYERYAPLWLPHILKRFVAAEITRTGFPFISTTSMGQDYGKSLHEWALTLATRTLSLRLCLVIAATNYAINELVSVPTEKMLVDWVYKFCRKINHDATGAHEQSMRDSDLKDKNLGPLWDFMSL